MELKSLEFIAFASIFVFAYFAVYKIPKAQRYVLLAANTLFIRKTSGIKSLVIIACLCAIHYTIGLLIQKNNEKKNKLYAKMLMWLGIISAVGILCYFKFFKNTFILIQDLLSQHGIMVSRLISPIGISYYTLSLIAYNIDVYHKKHRAEKNIIDFYVFITFFPAIIQGPINLYKKVGSQFKENHAPEADRIIMGIQRTLWGYVKKVVIADRIGILVTGILQDSGSSLFLVIWAMVLYSFQIYTDFSGGIDAVMGISEVMGIKLTENFKAPLVSRSVTEYWQRWHMSLGEFMEKYIYYPIVLNRKVMKLSKKIPNTYLQKVFSAALASFIVFIIVGIWHGTGWNYVVYGCYQAFFVSTAVLFGPIYKKSRTILHIKEQTISWRIFQTVRTFFILVIGRFFIRAANLTQAVELLHRAFDNFKWKRIHVLFDGTLYNYGLDYKNLYLMYFGIFFIIVVDIFHEKGIHFRERLMKQDICFRFAIYLIAIFTIIIFGIYGPEFSGSSFIYQEY